MKVSELGEFGLIEFLAGIVDKSRNSQDEAWQKLLVGIGDDAAAWYGGNFIQLATTDSLVQDVHFSLDTTGWEDLGWKAMAVNLSDIAAMGGVPRYALVSLALPGELEADCIFNLYEGMVSVANQFGVAIIGGDVVAADKVLITVTILGGLENEFALTRSAAACGDQIAVTGYLGLSSAGLRMLTDKLKFDNDTARLLGQAFLRPVPRVEEGQILLEEGVKAAIDISDGLIADLRQLCKASRVTAQIEEALVPVHPLLEASFKTDCHQLALTGGEDYELLFTASNSVIDRIKRYLTCPVTVIGKVIEGVPGEVILTDNTGKIIRWQQGGWEHFRS